MSGVGAPAATGPAPRLPRRPDATSLRRLYVDEGLTIAALAASLGVATGTAHKWLVASGVPRRKSAATVRVDVSDVEIRRLYEVEGWTAAEIGARLGCPTTTVYTRLRRVGVPRRPARPRHSSRPADTELRRLYLEEGLSQRRLANRFSVSPQAVSGWLRAAGVPKRAPAGPSPSVDSADIVALYRRGWSGPHIAALFCCSTATVYQRLDAAGLARRGRRPALDRPALLEALDADLSATDIAAGFDVSVSTVCRALAREGLHTASQIRRLRAAERYATLLTLAEESRHADGATIEQLRRRLRPRSRHSVSA